MSNLLRSLFAKVMKNHFINYVKDLIILDFTLNHICIDVIL
jgi:hypothetical protein